MGDYALEVGALEESHAAVAGLNHGEGRTMREPLGPNREIEGAPKGG